MKLRLLDFLICACGEKFTLKADQTERVEYAPEWKEKLDHYLENCYSDKSDEELKTLRESYDVRVLSGELKCPACSVTYPIENGIPRILPPELRTEAGELERGAPLKDTSAHDYLEGEQPGEQEKEIFDDLQRATQTSFGYQWQTFTHEYDKWEKLYDEFYSFKDTSFFANKCGLDAGCGMGRYTLVPVKRGAEMVGVDLSNAVEAAYLKSKGVPTFHVVQGDIFNLPFRDDFFEFAQSLGVIHHTPNPPGALQSIKRVVRPLGEIFIMVYKDFKDDSLLKHGLLKIATWIRKFTVRIPSALLKRILLFMVPVVLVCFYFPSWIFWRIPGGKRISCIFPFSYDVYHDRPWRDFHMNLMDRFGTSVEKRYDRQEIESLMEGAGFESFNLRGGHFWTVHAIKRGSASNG